MVTAQDVANVFLKLSHPELGDVLTNLKLQKLVYYAQGFNLAINKEPLFSENILAWEHGPVVRELYDALKQYGSDSVPVPEDDVSSNLTEVQVKLIEDVNQVYGQFSAWKLRDMTHQEEPWVSTERDNVISHELLQKYFSGLVVTTE